MIFYVIFYSGFDHFETAKYLAEFQATQTLSVGADATSELSAETYIKNLSEIFSNEGWITV